MHDALMILEILFRRCLFVLFSAFWLQHKNNTPGVLYCVYSCYCQKRGRGVSAILLQFIVDLCLASITPLLSGRLTGILLYCGDLQLAYIVHVINLYYLSRGGKVIP